MLVQDGNKLWRKKEEVFGKTWTWGRETFEYSNPEQAKGEAADRPRRAGASCQNSKEFKSVAIFAQGPWVLSVCCCCLQRRW
eukprot:2636363-Amphidinium_carterae.1